MSFVDDIKKHYVLAEAGDPTSKEFLDEFEKKYEKYKGWTFEYMYPGYHSYYRDGVHFFFTPDHNEDGRLDIQMQTNSEPIDKFWDVYGIPDEVKYEAPLTPDSLFAYVKPLLDKINMKMK